MTRKSKKDIIKDLIFCKDLMDRLVDQADRMGDSPHYSGRTVIQNDIIRLRRELNNIKADLQPWN